MLVEVSKKVLDIANRTQDEWIMELIVKHCSSEYKDKDLTNFDLMFLKTQFKLNIERENNKINVYVENELVGQWSENSEFILEDINSKWKVRSWIKGEDLT